MSPHTPSPSQIDVPPKVKDSAQGPIERWLAEKVTEEDYQPDPAQQSLARRFDQLLSAIEERDSRRGLGGWLRRGWRGGNQGAASAGLYVFGDVGRGKTMLMDHFFERLASPKKKRAHFHHFMREVHAKVFARRQTEAGSKKSAGDPLIPVAREIASEVQILCLDEFIVEDIADAMILGRLFTELFSLGVILVTTSNTLPQNLYEDGLNRSLFLPFVDLLREMVDLFHLDAAADYRLINFVRAGTYFCPNHAESQQAMEALWQSLAERPLNACEEAEIPHTGRSIVVPHAHKDLAFFSFSALLEAPFGTNDYLALAQHYDTLFVADVPVIGPSKLNAGKRMILLVDIFYDERRALVLSAARPVEALFEGLNLPGLERTCSRLIEMQSQAYLANRRKSTTK